VVFDQSRGALGVAVGDRLGDGLVLVPDRLALAGVLQHRAHHAAQVDPVQVRAGGDERVARGGIDGVVERHVGLDHRLDVVAGGSAAPVGDEAGVEPGAPVRGEPGRQRIERGAHLVDLGDPARIEGRDEEAAPRRIERQAVLLEQAQGLQHGLARHREPGRDVLLAEPRARRQRAVADGVEQGPIDAVDEVGCRWKLNELGRHV